MGLFKKCFALFSFYPDRPGSKLQIAGAHFDVLYGLLLKTYIFFPGEMPPIRLFSGAGGSCGRLGVESFAFDRLAEVGNKSKSSQVEVTKLVQFPIRHLNIPPSFSHNNHLCTRRERAPSSERPAVNADRILEFDGRQLDVAGPPWARVGSRMLLSCIIRCGIE